MSELVNTAAWVEEQLGHPIIRTVGQGWRLSGLELSTDPPPDERYDLILTLMALHHIPHLPPVLEGFSTLLNDGGRVCIIDLEAEGGSFHKPGFEGHNGFVRAKLASWLAAARLAPTQFEHCFDPDKNGRSYGLFVAVTQAAA